MGEKLAQIPLYDQGGAGGADELHGVGDIGQNASTTGLTTFIAFLTSVIGIMTAVAAIWFTFQFIIGAIGIISAGGDAKKMEGSVTKIRNAIIGIVVVVVAIFAVDLIGGIIGFDVLNAVADTLGLSGGGGAGTPQIPQVI